MLPEDDSFYKALADDTSSSCQYIRGRFYPLIFDMGATYFQPRLKILGTHGRKWYLRNI